MPNGKYCCVICDNRPEYSNKSNLIRHWDRQHNGLELYEQGGDVLTILENSKREKMLKEYREAEAKDSNLGFRKRDML